MTSRALRRPHGDEGAVLLFALIFIGVISVVLTSVLDLSTAGSRSVNVSRENVAKRYAADAALKYAVQELRVKTEACGGSPDTLTPPLGSLLTSNGGGLSTNTATPSVSVTCSVTGSGYRYGAAGYTLITTDTSNVSGAEGMEVVGASSETLPVNGPVFIASKPTTLQLTITNGDAKMFTNGGSCPTTAPAKLFVALPYAFGCLSTRPAPAITLPTALPTVRTGAVPLLSTPTVCGFYLPGTYRAVTDFATYDNLYFASGVYYLEDVDLTISKGTLFAGRPYSAATEPRETTGGTPCSDDSYAPPAVTDVNGTGVKIILGGNSKLIADNPTGIIEMYSRNADAAHAAGEGTQGVSLMTVPAGATGGWVPIGTGVIPDYATFRVGAAAASGGGGSKISFAAHGLLYAPDSFVQLRAASTDIKLDGGLVAGRLSISASSVVGGFTLKVNPVALPRTLHLVATARVGASDPKPVTASADISVEAQTGKVAISSWLSPL